MFAALLAVFGAPGGTGAPANLPGGAGVVAAPAGGAVASALPPLPAGRSGPVAGGEAPPTGAASAGLHAAGVPLPAFSVEGQPVLPEAHAVGLPPAGRPAQPSGGGADPFAAGPGDGRPGRGVPPVAAPPTGSSPGGPMPPQAGRPAPGVPSMAVRETPEPGPSAAVPAAGAGGGPGPHVETAVAPQSHVATARAAAPASDPADLAFAQPGEDPEPAGDGIASGRLPPLAEPGRAGPSPHAADTPPRPGSPAPALPAVPPRDLPALALQAFAGGRQTLLVALEPATLGRVQVAFEFGPDGRVGLRLKAEKAEALERLQRESATFARIFGAHGLDLDTAAVSFGLLGPDGDSAGNSDGGQRRGTARDGSGEAGASFATVLEHLFDLRT